MSTLSVQNPTLLDFANELGPDGKTIRDVAEVLELKNEILTDMTVTEGNETTGHSFLMRTGTATPTWMKINGYINATKNTSIPVTQTCGRLSSLLEVDPELADRGGNRERFLRNQDVGSMGGMADEMAATLFSGNESTKPESFTGFGPYYNLSTGNENSSHVLKHDEAATTNSDIWLIGWSPTTVHGFFPNGSKGGLQFEDMGIQLVSNATGGRAKRIVHTWDWRLGLALEDWRYVARAHFGLTLAAGYLTGSANTSMIDMMIEMEDLMPSKSDVRLVYYLSQNGLTMLRKQIKKDMTGNLSYETVGGRPVTMFNGIPCVRTDAILNNQSALTA